MGMELEWKFRADDRQQAAVLASYGPWCEIRMQTTYYDTPDRAFSARHITLRRRLESGISICTVKTPAANGARGEWECQCENIEESIDILCKLGAPQEIRLLAASGLKPVCGAEFIRQACQVSFGSGAVEIAVDKGWLFGGGREIPLCEIEAELKAGTPEAAAAFAAQLAVQFDLQPENQSKFRRASRLAEGGI